jgi:hypothetical protein
MGCAGGVTVWRSSGPAGAGGGKREVEQFASGAGGSFRSGGRHTRAAVHLAVMTGGCRHIGNPPLVTGYAAAGCPRGRAAGASVRR